MESSTRNYNDLFTKAACQSENFKAALIFKKKPKKIQEKSFEINNNLPITAKIIPKYGGTRKYGQHQMYGYFG
jgi:hypothetical protein